MSAAQCSLTRVDEDGGFVELHDLIGELPRHDDVSGALRAIGRAFANALRFPLAIVVLQGDAVCTQHHTAGFLPDAGALAAARSAISSGSVLRRGHSYFLPLRSWKGTRGAFAFKCGGDPISSRQWRLIHSFANLTALALLRSASDELSEADRLQKALLNSIAHNVRTPLASVIGVLSTLQEDDGVLNAAVRDELLDNARQEAERLNRLLGNLLDLSRLEGGALQVRSDPCDVQDVIGAALEQLGAAARKRRIEVAVDPNLPLVKMDFVLIVQVLVNVLDNAFKYAPEEKPIAISACLRGESLEVRISDEGDGIAERDLIHVFEKFNRAGRTGETGGIGLGLSICKGFVEAHKGTIRAERRNSCGNSRGTAVTFSVPLGSRREG